MILRPLLAACLSLAMLAAAQGADPLAQAELTIRVRDGRWVDREVTRFAAAYGGDLAAMRAELARVLYRSRAFDGIDLGRPSVIAWRGGKAPLIAAIPVTSRDKFLASFGAVDPGEPPLVRVGERDGTVIYRQNQPGGEWEYRLLVAANVAYLARSADECRTLAATLGSPAIDPYAAPVEATLRGGGLTNPRIPGTDWLSGLPALPGDLAEAGSMPGLLQRAWSGLAAQMTAVTLTARSGAQGDLDLSIRLSATQDSALAAWIIAQRPSTERLASQMRTAATCLLVSGRLSFQGQLERWAFEQVEPVREAAGKHWSDAADAAMRGLCTLLERSGAWAVAIERSDPGLIQQWTVEHPRALELVQHAAVIAAALRGVGLENQKIQNRHATSLALNDGSSVMLAGDRHALRLDDHAARRVATAAADALKRLDEPGKLDAAPTLATLWMDLALAWNAPPPPDADRAEPVIVQGLLRQSGTSGLELRADLPLARLGALLGRLNKTTRNEP